jgi:hypothetical protein
MPFSLFMSADMIPIEYAFPQLCAGVVELSMSDGKIYAKKTIATRYLRESVVVIKTSIKERFGQTVFLPFPTTITRGRIFEIEYT